MRNDDTMQMLNDRKQCRKKLHVFFGSRDNQYHPIKELLANSIDEISSNFDEGKIIVTLLKDNATITVEDTGRGLPILGEFNGIPKYKGLFEKLFAGTKYDVSNKKQTGTNGVGLTVINNTSLFLNAIVKTSGKEYTIDYVDGVSEKGLICHKDTKEHGTTITFKLDPMVYTNTLFDKEEIKQILVKYAAVANQVHFYFRYEGDEEEYFHYNTMEDYFNECIGMTRTSKNLSLVGTEYITDNQKDEEGNLIKEIDVISLQLCTTTEPLGHTWLNNNYFPENGTIYDGVIKGVKGFFSSYLKQHKILEKGAITNEDVERSIGFCCSTLSNNPEFVGQTKFSTSKKLYEKLVKQHVTELLTISEAENPKCIEQIARHIAKVHKENTAIEQKRKKLKKALTQNAGPGLASPKKLHDCKYRGKGTSIFIGEGDSALGSLLKARDADYQAVTCVRGKILNAAKKSIEEVLANETLQNFITILGCGIKIDDKKFKNLSNFDINNLNYENIILATDADPDGFQIRQLLAIFFYYYMPEIIKQKRLFFAQTPLYQVRYGNDETMYIYSEEEKEKKLSTIKGKYTMGRLKGLGELDAKVLYETAMCEDTRSWIQVTLEDIEKAEEMLEVWMGDDTSKRKEVIKEYMALVDLED